MWANCLGRQHKILENATSRDPANVKSWRTFFPLEFSGLGGWPKQGERINDCPNNTYRALRFVTGTSNSTFAELTTVSDYHYSNPNWREFYNLDTDPFQLTNLWPTSAPNQSSLLELLNSTWHCAGLNCP